jgi:hypothetical protein
MKKLITVIALATTVISAPAFAKTSVRGTAATQQQMQDQGIPWVVDHAKGYEGSDAYTPM